MKVTCKKGERYIICPHIDRGDGQATRGNVMRLEGIKMAESDVPSGPGLRPRDSLIAGQYVQWFFGCHACLITFTGATDKGEPVFLRMREGILPGDMVIERDEAGVN